MRTRLLTRTAVVLALSAFLGSGTASASAEEKPVERHVSVIGTATAQVEPDTVVWSIIITETDRELGLAKERSDARIRTTMDLARGLDVKPEDVQSSYASISKEFERDQHGNETVFKHYRVSRRMMVKQRDLSRFDEFLGKLLSEAQAEANYQLEASNMEEIRAETRKKAVRAAREKATAMLAELGVSLGPVLAIDEELERGPAPPAMSNVWFSYADTGGRAGGGGESSLAVGTVEVVVSIKVRFGIDN